MFVPLRVWGAENGAPRAVCTHKTQLNLCPSSFRANCLLQVSFPKHRARAPATAGQVGRGGGVGVVVVAGPLRCPRAIAEARGIQRDVGPRRRPPPAVPCPAGEPCSCAPSFSHPRSHVGRGQGVHGLGWGEAGRQTCPLPKGPPPSDISSQGPKPV